MLEYDAIVVGAGPIGGNIASKIAKEKFKVAIFEKNKSIGEKLSCAGLVTNRIFDFVEISKDKVIQNEIKGANIHSPYNKILKIGGDKTHAICIDRLKFDKEIVRVSSINGADVFPQNKVISIKKIKNEWKIKTSEGKEAVCKILIGADGPNSFVRKCLSFPNPKEYLVGIGAEVEDTNLDPNFVEIFLGKNIAPGFFAWIIPTNKDGTKARIGLCTTEKTANNIKFYFNNMLNHRYTKPYLKDCKIVRNISGLIPVGIISKTYSDNVMIAGDAAAQVKPTSGGGLYPGLLSSNYCASVAIEALEKNNFSSKFLKKYQMLWQSEIGHELKIGMVLRSVFKKLSDKIIDKYIEKFQRSEILEIINRYGDIDYPSKLIKPMIKKISLII